MVTRRAAGGIAFGVAVRFRHTPPKAAPPSAALRDHQTHAEGYLSR
jgi:hypothetical protein